MLGVFSITCEDRELIVIDPTHLLDQLGFLPEQKTPEEEIASSMRRIRDTEEGGWIDASESIRQLREKYDF